MGDRAVTAAHAQCYLIANLVAQPGQIDGHAFCVINDKLVADFGLGVERRQSSIRVAPE